MYKVSEILGEIDGYNSLLYSDDKYRLLSIPNISRNPCFVISRGYNKVTRISLLEPKYVKSEFRNYKLNKEEIDDLIKILNCRPNRIYKEFEELTVWKTLLYEQNFELEGMTDDQGNSFHIDENLPIPDYYQLLNS